MTEPVSSPPRPTTVPWSVAVDFGTSNTAAAIRTAQIRPVQLDNSTTMPSCVVVIGDQIRVGQSAENAARAHPATFVRAPKKIIGEGPILLNDHEYEPAELVAEVLKVVRQRAVGLAGGGEPEYVLMTHPASWGPNRISELTRAAQLAGFAAQSIAAIAEPLAALWYYAADSNLPAGARVAVFDFGGGTCDVAILERTELQEPGKQYTVISVAGDDLLGGDTFDSALYEWVIAQLGATGQTAVVEALAAPAGVGSRLTLLRSVRSAKEDLSSNPDSDIPVSAGGHEAVVTITRAEYEALIANDVERATALLTDLLAETSTTLTSLYLTGGSSRTPAIARALTEATGVTPATLSDPKLVVAEGALSAPAPRELAAVEEELRGSEVAGGTVGSEIEGKVAGPDVVSPEVESGTAAPEVGGGLTDSGVKGGVVGPAVVEPVAVVAPAVVGPALVSPPGFGPEVVGRPPARPWYRGPLLALPIVAGVLLLLIVIPVIIVAASLRSTPTTPAAKVSCWDGSKALAGSCPKLQGADALMWVFGTPSGTTAPNCDDANLASQFTNYPGVQEVFQCAWADLPGTKSYLYRFDSVDHARSAAKTLMGGATPSSVDIQGSPKGALQEWTYSDSTVSGVIDAYNVEPFALETITETTAGGDLSDTDTASDGWAYRNTADLENAVNRGQ